MSSDSETPAIPEDAALGEGRLWRHLPRAVTVLLLLATVGGALIGGCIRRYPAPTDAAPVDAPYSATAAWRQVSLPPLDETTEGQPLPQPALRLSFDDQGRPWMDSALVDGADAATTHEELDAALDALRSRSEDIVVIGVDGLPCAQLEPLAARIHVAAGPSSYDGTKKKSGAREETLRGVPLSVVCPPEGESPANGSAPATD